MGILSSNRSEPKLFVIVTYGQNTFGYAYLNLEQTHYLVMKYHISLTFLLLRFLVSSFLYSILYSYLYFPFCLSVPGNKEFWNKLQIALIDLCFCFENTCVAHDDIIISLYNPVLLLQLSLSTGFLCI